MGIKVFDIDNILMFSSDILHDFYFYFSRIIKIFFFDWIIE